MKRGLSLLLILALALSGCAAEERGGTGQNDPPHYAEPIAVRTGETTIKFAAEIGFRNGDEYMSIELPEDWGYERVNSTYGNMLDVPDGSCGLMLYPMDGSGTMTLLYYQYPFGVCGTGLEQKTLSLTSGGSALVGYYDGNPTWYFVSFQDLSNPYAAQNHGLSGKDAEAALAILSTAKLTAFEPKTEFENVGEMLEYWETLDCEPEWVSSISSTNGGSGITVLLVEGYEDRAIELRSMLRDDGGLTVETGGKYSDLELKRINTEIADNYMPPSDGEPAIASCGVGWHTLDGQLVGFGESGRECRVVAEVLREHADEYRALFEQLYGDKVVVEEVDGFATVEEADGLAAPD